MLRVNEMLEQMEIAHLKDRSPHHLSTGEKKRVALASVLILDPEVLLLDEPTAALDPKSESQMIDFLVSCSGGRKTVVTATHDLDLVEDIADTCHVFQRGRIVAAGTPSEDLERPRAAAQHKSHPRPSSRTCARRPSFPSSPPRSPTLTSLSSRAELKPFACEWFTQSRDLVFAGDAAERRMSVAKISPFRQEYVVAKGVLRLRRPIRKRIAAPLRMTAM